MIQRIQSLYLFIGAALLSACLFMPLWTGMVAPENKLVLDAFSITSVYPHDYTPIENTAYIGIGLVISILLSLFIIMQFKNRRLQIKLSMVNALLIFIVIGLIYWKCDQLLEATKVNGKPVGDYRIAFFFPAIAVMLNLLAMRSIKKDEELVRSADRIR